jgi:hypothetical protein
MKVSAKSFSSLSNDFTYSNLEFTIPSPLFLKDDTTYGGIPIPFSEFTLLDKSWSIQSELLLFLDWLIGIL